jgi:MurNAc alpha-1-phosphate uridylyltransferase
VYAGRLASQADPGMHLVMVPNPPFHPTGDFGLVDGVVSSDAQPRLTFGSIALYDTRMFRALPRGTRRALTPYYRETIARGLASGERYDGLWENVGTPAQLQALDERLRLASTE